MKEKLRPLRRSSWRQRGQSPAPFYIHGPAILRSRRALARGRHQVASSEGSKRFPHYELGICLQNSILGRGLGTRNRPFLPRKSQWNCSKSLFALLSGEKPDINFSIETRLFPQPKPATFQLKSRTDGVRNTPLGGAVSSMPSVKAWVASLGFFCTFAVPSRRKLRQ